MKKILILSCVLLLNLTVTAPLYAAVDWNNLPANDFVKTAVSEVEKTQNFKVDSLSAGYVYKKMGDKKALFYNGVSQTGSIYNSPIGTSLLISSSTVVYEMGKAKPKVIYAMDVISDGNSIFFKVDQLKNKILRNKWIKANSAQYEAIGVGLKVAELFNAFDSSTRTEAKTKFDKITAAYTKAQYWQKFNEEIVDDFTVTNATRYNFEPRQAAIESYFKEINTTLTLKELGYSASSFKNLLSSLSNDDITEFMAANSYMSVWIDNVSKKPVRIVSIEWIPVIEKKKTVYVLTLQDTEFSGFDTQAKLVIPAISTDALSAAKLLKIKL